MAYPSLKKGGTKSIARALCPSTLTAPPNQHVLEGHADKEGCFRTSSDEKLQFRERILEASKLVVGSSCRTRLIVHNTSFQLEVISEIVTPEKIS